MSRQTLNGPATGEHAAPLQGERAGLSIVVGSFKAAASKRAESKLWQRGFYERIVRSEQELNLIRKYIEENPLIMASEQNTLRAL